MREEVAERLRKDVQEREKEIRDKETEEIRAELEKESKSREEQVEDFLDKQTEELMSLVQSQRDADPERILEIRQKRQLVKTKLKAYLLSKASVQNRNWRIDLRKEVRDKMAQINIEDILQSEADTDPLRTIALDQGKKMRKAGTKASSPRVNVLPLGRSGL